MSVILHLMGPTGAGKSTLIEHLLRLDPDRIGAVEVGKEMRARYGEKRFKGQAAPPDLQDVAWEIYCHGVAEHLASGKELILVDGQPRDATQAEEIVHRWRYPAQSQFAMVHADHEVREDRVRGSRRGDSLDLALQRMTNDYRNCYIVLIELARHDQVVRVWDTSGLSDPIHLAKVIRDEYIGRS